MTTGIWYRISKLKFTHAKNKSSINLPLPDMNFVLY